MVEATPSLQQVALQARLAHAAITLARQRGREGRRDGAASAKG